jgi:predicted transposase/invertase (TIGR01784 family)
MKYVRQLEVLSNLRNLQEETIKQIETMPFTYNLESDIRYKQGIEKGIERGIEKGIERGIEKGIESKSLEIANKMILSGIFSTEQIVDFSGLSLEKVKGLMKKKKKS